MTCSVVRPTPCGACPYRLNAPSGVWAEEEYAKLTQFDGDVWEQSPAAFSCHASPADLCAGWVGHREEPRDLLAVRLGIASGHIAPEVVEYTTDVPLFRSGAEAAAHGCRDILDPGPEARAAIEKLIRLRGVSGDRLGGG